MRLLDDRQHKNNRTIKEIESEKKKSKEKTYICGKYRTSSLYGTLTQFYEF